jgi:hypothetical protein
VQNGGNCVRIIEGQREVNGCVVQQHMQHAILYHTYQIFGLRRDCEFCIRNAWFGKRFFWRVLVGSWAGEGEIKEK